MQQTEIGQLTQENLILHTPGLINKDLILPPTLGKFESEKNKTAESKKQSGEDDDFEIELEYDCSSLTLE